MKYYSTNRQAPTVSFREAVVQGQAPDGGLYFPDEIPLFEKHILSRDKNEIAFSVMRNYAGDEIPADVLKQIAQEAVAFDFPLVPLKENMDILELFHGPTLAFKDVGARFMSRCLGYFNEANQKKVTVLVATSGDTGGAVANGFEGVHGVEVIILYPAGKVSPVQELQLTTCGTNIFAIEIEGSFDDCQAMVKTAFRDEDLRSVYQLTSANSINVARWLPQQLYYLFAMQQWKGKSRPVVSVPSGNFGNICAGMLAFKSGLPIGHFIAACNSNDTIPHFLQTGQMPEKPAVATISNAMDVARPSNFVRILEIFGDIEAVKKHLTAVSISEEKTRETIRQVYAQNGYTLDPHGAVGFAALQEFLAEEPGHNGFVLGTAHPVKFPDVVEAETGTPPPIPEELIPLFEKEKRSTVLPASFEKLKSYLIQRSH